MCSNCTDDEGLGGKNKSRLECERLLFAPAARTPTPVARPSLLNNAIYACCLGRNQITCIDAFMRHPWAYEPDCEGDVCGALPHARATAAHD
jgi:hypothetical protein